MIPFASQRGGGQDLANHLMKGYPDNEVTELYEIRGGISADLNGFFKEEQVKAETLTRCKQYLYSMSINPDPAQRPLARDEYMDYIARTEAALGLCGQPRAIVFHTKYGREHCHVVWSRIDAENRKAVHLDYDHSKLMKVTRAFALDHGLRLPEGYNKSRQVGQITLYEKEQERETGISKVDHSRTVTEAWRRSDSAKAFVQALAQQGYILATGNRPYVLVDHYGNINALPKLIDDKSVRTKDIRSFLEKDFPLDSLPSIEEARKLIAEKRNQTEVRAEDSSDTELAALKDRQQEKAKARQDELERIRNAGREKINALMLRHREERDLLRTQSIGKLKRVRELRNSNQPTGLAAFLGRVTGITALQEMHRRRYDANLIRSYQDKKAETQQRQQRELRILQLRVSIPLKSKERIAKARHEIERREVASALQTIRREQRVRARAAEGMPSLVDIASQLFKGRAEFRLKDIFKQVDGKEAVRLPNAKEAFLEAAERYKTMMQARQEKKLSKDFNRTNGKGRKR